MSENQIAEWEREIKRLSEKVAFASGGRVAFVKIERQEVTLTGEPKRKHHDWHNSKWGNCDCCGEHKGLVPADGEMICASCIDASYLQIWMRLDPSRMRGLWRNWPGLRDQQESRQDMAARGCGSRLEW